MDYKLSSQLIQEIVNVLQEIPYKISFKALNALLTAINDQDRAAKLVKAEEEKP